jgi:hypothetical protein
MLTNSGSDNPRYREQTEESGAIRLSRKLHDLGITSLT